MNGNLTAWATEHGIPPSYVSEVLRGLREPSEAVLRPLNLERVMLYRGRAA